MPRAVFRIMDVQRAIKAGQALGLPVAGYEIGADGRIIVHTVPGEAEKLTPYEKWDAVHGKS